MSNSFYSVFMDPDRGPVKRDCYGTSLRDEVHNAKTLDSEGFLYSRTALRIPMVTGKRYKLTWSAATGRYGYVLDGHYIRGAFDYFTVDLNGVLSMDIEHHVVIPELGVERVVELTLKFDAARSLKFIDLTKQYDCCVEFKNSKAMLVFYDQVVAVGEVELRQVRDTKRWAA